YFDFIMVNLLMILKQMNTRKSSPYYTGESKNTKDINSYGIRNSGKIKIQGIVFARLTGVKTQLRTNALIDNASSIQVHWPTNTQMIIKIIMVLKQPPPNFHAP